MQRQPQPQEHKGQTLNVLSAIMSGWALTIYVWMRKGIGRNHVGVNGLFGMAWILLWVAYTKVDGLFWLIPMFVIGHALHQLGHVKTRAIHTKYGGEPIVAMKLLRIKDEAFAKRFGEPLIAALAGGAMLACGYEEGKYFLFGAVAMMATATFEHRYLRQRLDDINDGIIEGQFVAANRRRS